MGLFSGIGKIAGGVFGGPLGGIAGSVLGGFLDKGYERDAAREQQSGYQKGIDYFNNIVNEARRNYSPYITAGSNAINSLPEYSKAGIPALNSIMDIVGLSGAENQKNAIKSIEESPYAQYLFKQGENAILQNASATGGLRGGNIQSFLADFRPRILNDLIEQQYSRLGNLMSFGRDNTSQIAGMGQNATGDLAKIGMGAAQNLAPLYQGLAGANINYLDAKQRTSVPGIIGTGISQALNSPLFSNGGINNWVNTPNQISSGIGSFFRNNLPVARNTQ